MGGFNYMQYIAPGLIMMAVITNSYGNVVSSFFGAKFGRHIEELLVAPLPNWLIVLGYVAGGVMRGLLVGLVVTLVALFFTHLHVEHPLLVVGGVVLTSTCSRSAVSSTRCSPRTSTRSRGSDLRADAADLPRRRVLLDQLLPDWAQGVSRANPILYMVNAFRHGFLGEVRRGPRLLVPDHGARGRGDVRGLVWLLERGTGHPRLGRSTRHVRPLRFFLARRSHRRDFRSADGTPEVEPRYNIAPTQSVAAIRAGEEGARTLSMLHWGLVPKWAKERAIGNA